MNQIIKINDELFLVKRIAGEHYGRFAHLWNELSPTNKVFKKDNQMYFCEVIEEANIVEN
jgi:hypothetical protein